MSDRPHHPSLQADLLRYAVLYIYGGIYLDVDTILIRPLDEVFPLTHLAYTSNSKKPVNIFQAILAAPPRNPLLLELLTHVVHTPLAKVREREVACQVL